MSEHAMKHLSLLGLKVKDKVTGVKGVVTTVSFDLYGCIQVIIDRGLKKDGTAYDSRWLDVSRLYILKKTPVMQVPDYQRGYVAEGRQGSADKPLP